mmetsp:Transcript_24667/g.64078  ORF Transcript_24667/g.64078 Transcript_24667/m.64078 type:complete len:410 (-) Transcript_24667:202-1431(-)
MQPGQTWRCLLLQFVSGASADRIRGVARYFRVAFPKGRIIPACVVAADAPGACVYVSPSGEIVHGRDYGTAGDAAKQMLLDNFLRGVTARLRYNATRWISLAVAYGASGATAPLGRGPTVAFAAKDPRHSEALLVPNPFFISPDWWDARTEAWLAAAHKRPWATRDRRVLFRGSCGPGAAARFDLMAMPDPGSRLDIGFTSVDGFPSIDKCAAALAAAASAPPETDGLVRERVAPVVPTANFSRYRYLLHLPGAATGSYSRNLQFLWSHGAVVFIWKHDAVEWYYADLVDGVHYVSVTAETLLEKVASVDADSEMRRALRRGARRFARKHLSGEALAARWAAIFDVLATRQADAAPSPVGCTCDAALLADRRWVECSKCAIARKRAGAMAKFIGLVPRRRWDLVRSADW